MILIGMFAFLSIAILEAQSSLPSTDCGGALLTLEDINIFLDGGLGIQELNTQETRGCLLQGEHNTVWIEIRIADGIPENSPFTFLIHPSLEETDLDFAIYGPNVSCNDLGAPIRCTYADENDSFNIIGLRKGETDIAEGASTGNGFLKPLTVNSGERYYLVVDDFDLAQTGFNLIWGEEVHENNLLSDSDCYHSVELPQDFNICQGEFFQVDPIVYNGSQSFEYEWTTSLESLETTIQDGILTATPPDDFLGEITLEVSVFDIGVEDCERRKSVTVHVLSPEDCTMTIENSFSHSFQIYPNPAHDFLQISLTSPPIATAFSLQCYNAQGQLMHQELIHIGGNEWSYLLEVADFPEGVYYVHLQTDRGVVVEKVLVVR